MIKYLLAPLSTLYYVGYLADKNLTEPQKLSKPVISAGNITWGGAGKTPTVIKLAEEFLSAGKRVAILSRGYKRRLKVKGERLKANASALGDKEPLIVSDGEKILVSPEESGDEPYLMAEKLKGAVILVGANRYLAAKIAIGNFSADVLLLDDGFQYWALARELDIVCIDAQNPFGNGFLIPAGILREPISALKRADLIALTNTDKVSAQSLLQLKRKIADVSPAPIVLLKYSITDIKNVFTGNSEKIDNSKEVVGFSAIGNNKSFKETLNSLNLNLKRFYSFLDHTWYNEKTLSRMLFENPGALFITTLKDAVKLRQRQNLPKTKFFYIDIKLEFIEGEDIWQKKIKQFF